MLKSVIALLRKRVVLSESNCPAEWAPYHPIEKYAFPACLFLLVPLTSGVQPVKVDLGLKEEYPRFLLLVLVVETFPALFDVFWFWFVLSTFRSSNSTKSILSQS